MVPMTNHALWKARARATRAGDPAAGGAGPVDGPAPRGMRRRASASPVLCQAILSMNSTSKGWSASLTPSARVMRWIVCSGSSPSSLRFRYLANSSKEAVLPPEAALPQEAVLQPEDVLPRETTPSWTPALPELSQPSLWHRLSRLWSPALPKPLHRLCRSTVPLHSLGLTCWSGFN